MPTYDYECEKCKAVFEEYQSIIAEPLTKCRVEGCGGNVHRLISPGAGFLFKGDGFYITDYRSKDYKQKAQAEKTGNSAPAAPVSPPPSAPAASQSSSSSSSTTAPPAKKTPPSSRSGSS